MKSINGLKFDPISGINTGVDLFAMVGPVFAMPRMARVSRREKTPNRIRIIAVRMMGTSKSP
jgi:hypothetical protein